VDRAEPSCDPSFLYVTKAQSSESAPVFKITPVVSKVTFYVKSSVKLEGTFEKWEATLVFASTDASTGVLDVKIQADSVNKGSTSKDDKLKGEHCFDVKNNPYMTFHSTKITQTIPNTFDVAGTFTLRGISKPEALTFTVDRDARGGHRGDCRPCIRHRLQGNTRRTCSGL
jgi:polyisoprenoid-binding protein YceI